MTINRFILNIVKTLVLKDIKKRRKHYPSRSEFTSFINIPYLEDNNKYHTYDIYLANKENRKHCCFIDIHGGAYIFGEHFDNYPFAYVLLKEGYDVVLLDYEPNNGKRDFSTQFREIILNIEHLFKNLEKYDLQYDRFVITGDSAGGHFALLLSLALQNIEVSKTLNIELPRIPLIATVLNCPTYDFENMGKGSMTNSGLKRMLGPHYSNIDKLRKYSPRTYIKYNELPLFVSTCTNDFIREESLKLNEDMSGRPFYEFVDLKCDKKEVDHVHNVTKIDLEESQYINNLINEFVKKLL